MTQSDLLIRHFPGLSALPAQTLAALTRDSRAVTLAAGQRLFGPGQPPQAFLMLVSGRIRVQQSAENGREIVLYRVSAGESCILTTACLLGFSDYLAEGVTETPIEAIALPRQSFDRMIAESSEFRALVFRAYSHRITELFQVISEIVTARMDVRLAQKLLAAPEEAGCIPMTHQQLAAELGTAREVVSRQLGEFQRRGWITGERGRIHLLDRAAIRDLAGLQAG